jgi:hypothetical protein
MGTMARTAVIAGTATAVSSKTAAAMTGSAQAKQGAQQAQMQAMVDEQVQQQLADQQAQMEQQQAPPPPVAMAAPVADLDAAAMRITKLKELGALRDAGILTEAEFASEKARILAV